MDIPTILAVFTVWVGTFYGRADQPANFIPTEEAENAERVGITLCDAGS